MSPTRSFRIAVTGATLWQQARAADGAATERLAGAALIGMILAKWDVPVSLVSVIGDDDAGARARAILANGRVDLTHLATREGKLTTREIVSIDNSGTEIPVEDFQGPRLVRGDRLDIYDIFSHDLVLLDLDDFALRQFLVDLPAHTVPTTRLLGTLTGLTNPSEPERLRVALAHDAIVATEPEFLALTGAASLEAGLTQFHQTMRISNLRAAILLRSNGTTILTPAARSEVERSVSLTFSASARAAYLAGVAYGMAHRWPWDQVVRFAGGAATLTSTGPSGGADIPALDQISPRLDLNPAILNP
jgi:sugar/nucleoside kinase (ribokinase family)